MPHEETYLGSWMFDVFEDRHGDVVVHWTVLEADGSKHADKDESYEHVGTTHGPLHEAVLDAYDALGVTCPFVLDHDLLEMGGHE